MIEIRLPVNKTTILLRHLCKTYKLDFPTAALLYEKYGHDVFYFFYLFAGKKISFPRHAVVSNIAAFCSQLNSQVKGIRDAEPSNKRDENMLSDVKKDIKSGLIDDEFNEYVLEIS